VVPRCSFVGAKMVLMAPRPIPRTALHVRLPTAGYAALVVYAEREGVSLNTALWLLVRRGLEREGIRMETSHPHPEEVVPVAGEPAPSAAGEVVDVDEVVELVHHGEVGRRLPAGSAPSSSTPPPGPGRRRRRRR
jgi:hypothetical protein